MGGADGHLGQFARQRHPLVGRAVRHRAAVRIHEDAEPGTGAGRGGGLRGGGVLLGLAPAQARHPRRAHAARMAGRRLRVAGSGVVRGAHRRLGTDRRVVHPERGGRLALAGDGELRLERSARRQHAPLARVLQRDVDVGHGRLAPPHGAAHGRRRGAVQPARHAAGVRAFTCPPALVPGVPGAPPAGTRAHAHCAAVPVPPEGHAVHHPGELRLHQRDRPGAPVPAARPGAR